MNKKTKELGLSDLIYRIKQDLLSEAAHERDKLTVFSIDEITLEVNFVITGDINSGFNIGVVTLGSQVSEERIQKVTLKMTPLVTRDQIIEDIKKVGDWEKIKKISMKPLVKGDILGSEQQEEQLGEIGTEF